jgi:hypothetical protein
MGVGIVRGESSVGVPLRRFFRYEWMDVSYLSDSHRYSQFSERISDIYMCGKCFSSGERSGRITHGAHVMSLLHKTVILAYLELSVQRNPSPLLTMLHLTNTVFIFAELLYRVFCFSACAIILSLGCCMSPNKIIIPDCNTETKVRLRMRTGFSGFMIVASIYNTTLSSSSSTVESLLYLASAFKICLSFKVVVPLRNVHGTALVHRATAA